jgi:hypothetical protein
MLFRLKFGATGDLNWFRLFPGTLGEYRRSNPYDGTNVRAYDTTLAATQCHGTGRRYIRTLVLSYALRR